MVVAKGKYDVIDPETGKLDRRIFTDQAIYDEEMEKIFGRAWLMVAHTSLIPRPHDFFLSYMGQDPVIVTRDANDKIHVMLNMCRHRGNRVVRADDGNARSFMCTYHGWTYDSDGCLNHITGEQEAFYGDLNKAELGLIEAKVDTYAGIIFATWDQEAPTLEAWLGDARWYMDTTFNRSDAGMVAIGPQKWIEPCNWKTPVDNCSDNYHVPISHYSSVLARHQVSGDPINRSMKLALNNTGSHHAFVNGHGLTFRAAEDGTSLDEVGNAAVGGRSRGGTPEAQARSAEYRRMKEEELERRLGTYRAKNIRMGNHSVFPNHVLGFRLALPRGPYQTEFWHFALVEADAPEEMKQARSIASANQNGAAGIFEQDDMDNWGQVTHSGDSPQARRVPSLLPAGVGHAGRHEEWPGIVAERYISENNQRSFYHRWQEFMNAESWTDIHIDPITVKFEGTAGMHS